MERIDTDRLLSQLSRIAPMILHYSEVTKQYYWTMDGLDVIDGPILTSIVEHRYSPTSALVAYADALIGKNLRIKGVPLKVVCLYAKEASDAKAD